MPSTASPTLPGYVEQLPRDYHDVYVLAEFEHLANAEIARRLGLPLATVKIRLHRARTRLHEQLRRNCRCYYDERGQLMREPKRAVAPGAEKRPAHGKSWRRAASLIAITAGCLSLRSTVMA